MARDPGGRVESSGPLVVSTPTVEVPVGGGTGATPSVAKFSPLGGDRTSPGPFKGLKSAGGREGRQLPVHGEIMYDAGVLGGPG